MVLDLDMYIFMLVGVVVGDLNRTFFYSRLVLNDRTFINTRLQHFIGLICQDSNLPALERTHRFILFHTRSSTISTINKRKRTNKTVKRCDILYKEVW